MKPFMNKRILAVFSALFLCCDIATTQESSSPFKIGEILVAPSPAQASHWLIPAQTQVVDFDVSPSGPEVAILMRDANGAYSVLFWRIGTDAPTSSWMAPMGFQPKSLAWHPAERRFFLAGARGHQYQIVRVDTAAGNWQAKTIYTSNHEIRRMLPGPRPFRPDTDQPTAPAYRLFFGEMTANSAFAVVSVTEEGKRRYQVIGPKGGIDKKGDRAPSEIETDWALPASFHPSGNLLLWEDKTHKFNKASYGSFYWDKSMPLLPGQLSGGSITVTPNGAALALAARSSRCRGRFPMG
jgi:hypothetical protein